MRLPKTLDHSFDSKGVPASALIPVLNVPRRYRAVRGAMREQGRSRPGVASLPHVKLEPMNAPGSTGERQEHFDVVISFAGAGRRRRLFRGLDILTMKWTIGDLPEECRFLFNTQLMFLEKEKDTTMKFFDDEEWIRSFSAKVKLQPSRKCGSSELGLKAALRPRHLPPAHPRRKGFRIPESKTRVTFFPSMPPRTRWNTEPCPMLSKRGPPPMPRIAVLNKEVVAPQSAARWQPKHGDWC